MSESPAETLALPATEYLDPARYTGFYDRYREQYEQSVAWMERELARLAAQRDADRSHDAAWLRAQRERLAGCTGFDQAHSNVIHTELDPLVAGVSRYRVETENGLSFGGLVWEPVAGEPQGIVVIGGGEPAAWHEQIALYRSAGLRVVMPCLAQPLRTYADDPQRHWYTFADDELLHLFFFIVGGSVAGLEATEVAAVSAALAQQQGERLPVALHLRDRHLITALIAAAFAPVDLLLLGPEVGALEHQESDVRVNTLWGFHRHFDGLTLLQLAQTPHLLFLDPLATPSPAYSRARLWFEETADGEPVTDRRTVARMVAPEPDALAHAVAAALGTTGRTLSAAAASVGEQQWQAAYRSALDSKLAYLEGLHVSARQHRERRYDPTALTPEAYRARVAASLGRVAGPPLPETADRRPRTRRVLQQPAYALYEVLLSSVAGHDDGDGSHTHDMDRDVDVAGYLLLPTDSTPAPAIICQHGVGGRPDALVGLNDRLERQWVYDQFARRLAEKGYVVFVPFMNWGWPTTPARDRLVKHAYALGIAPNRFEVAQLHAIVDFLAGRPEVRTDRMAFYGLSYGGHASLWLCAHEARLAAVVTAGHFNDWQPKLTSTDISPPQERPTSFITVEEGYDMFNYNVLNELGHAELATRFAPRPYFVENGLRDSVTPTAWVDREFARVQAVFTRMDAAERVGLEHFHGPHRVWAEGSFRFLERHLRD